MKASTTRIRIVGVGGQGVIRASTTLAIAALIEGFEVSQSQAYGAEVTGTPSLGDVIISRKPIRFPYVETADVMVSLHNIGWKRYKDTLRDDGVLIYDSVLSDEASNHTVKYKYSIPAVKIAEEHIEDKMSFNMVILGYMVKCTNVVSLDSLIKAVRHIFGGDNVKVEKAVISGYEYVP